MLMNLQSFKEEEEPPCISMRKAIAKEDHTFTEEGVKLAHKGRVIDQLNVVQPGEWVR